MVFVIAGLTRNRHKNGSIVVHCRDKACLVSTNYQGIAGEARNDRIVYAQMSKLLLGEGSLPSSG